MYVRANQKRISELNREVTSMSDDKLEKEARRIVSKIVADLPFSFFNVLASKKMGRLRDIVVRETSFLDTYFKPNMSTRCYYFMNSLTEIKRCELESCGKPYAKQVSPVKTVEYFHCDTFCAQQDPRTKDKIDGTKTKNGTHTRDLLEEKKRYNREHYGVDWFFQTDAFQEKKAETCRDIYGCDHPMQSEELRREMADRYKAKHGVRSPFQNPDVKEKAKATNRKNLGCDYPSQNKELCCKKNQRSADTVKAEFYREKILNYTTAIPLFTEEEYVCNRHECSKCDNKIERFEFLWKCRKCGREFRQRMFKYPEPRCLACDPLIYQSTTSKFEQEVRESVGFVFGRAYDVVYRQPLNRSLITGADGSERELDIIMTDRKSGRPVFAVEADGIFYHSSAQKPAGYHLSKTVACEGLGVQLIHVWEDDWLNRYDETVRMLISFACGKADQLLPEYEKDGMLYLPRDRFSKAFIPAGWTLEEELPPRLVERRENESKKPIAVEDCGTLVYSRK